MPRFKHTDISQGQFMTVNLQEQLLLGSFEWTINYFIDGIDLSLFEKNYQNDELGAAAYPTGALLKAILYCYSKGIISSRKIEKTCRENIIAKALVEDFEPDHATIAELTKKRDKLVKYISRILSRHKEIDKDKASKKVQKNHGRRYCAQRAESGCFPEMLDNLEENMKTLTGKEKPLKNALVEGDTGYFSEENLQEAARRGIEVLIPDPQFRQRDPYFAEKKSEKVNKRKSLRWKIFPMMRKRIVTYALLEKC